MKEYKIIKTGMTPNKLQRRPSQAVKPTKKPKGK